MNKKNKEVKLQVRNGYHISGNPILITRELHKLYNRYGELTSEIVLEAARNKKSILHKQFDWNDTTAAEKYRRHQASNLVRSIEIVVIENKQVIEKVELWPSTRKNGIANYHPAHLVAKDKKLFNEVLKQALVELEVLEEKYSRLKELKSLWKELDNLKKELDY